MTVRKIRNSWWVDLRVDCKRYRKRSPENSKVGAEAYEATLRQRLSRGEAIDKERNAEKKKQTFREFAQEWYKQYVVTNNRFSECYAKQKVLDANLIPFFGRMALGEIGTIAVERFKAQQVASGLSNKTVNNKLTILSKCLKCAHEWYGTPMPIIKLLRYATPKTDYLTGNECDQLLQYAQGQLREMIFLAIRTGMRQGEIRGLQWTSIDWQNQSIAVRHSRCDRNMTLVAPKNNRERHIPLDSDAYAMLFRRKHATGYVFTDWQGKPYTSDRALLELGRVCKEARVRKIGWHALRHTFATQLTLRRVPLTVVKELLGHSSIMMTMRYSHVASSDLRSAIDLLNPRNAGIADFGQPVGNARQHLADSEAAYLGVGQNRR